MYQSFPTSRGLLAGKGTQAQAELAAAAFAAVDYHLELCRNAVSWSLRDLVDFQLGVDATTGAAYYITRMNEPLSLVQWGDVGVQAAVSTIEVSWSALNQVLGLGIPGTTPLRWWGSKPSQPGPLKQAIQNLSGDGSRELSDAIDRTFASIGYQLLTGYRNWVSHRGAPVQEPSTRVLGPIPIPDEVRAAPADERDKRLRFAAGKYLAGAYTVTCWPIVPPVHMRYSLQVGNAEQDMEFPGVRIGKGASVEINDMRIGVGSLWDSAADFERRNPLKLHSQKRTLMGEELAVYSGGDYRMALSRVEHFAQEAVTAVLDAPLCRVLEHRFSQSSPTPS